MNDIKYKIAESDDIDALVDSRVEFMEDYWGPQDTETENKLRVELRKFFKSAIPAETYISFLAYDGDLLVGVGGMNIQQRPGSFRVPDGKSGYIMNMYTKPAYRKRGIATELLDKLIQKGREMGLVYFDLNATKEGEPVYLKYGFTRHDEPNYRKVFL